MEKLQEIKKKRMTREEYCKILEEANAVKLYTEDGWNQEQISKEFKVSKGAVSTYLKTIKGITVRAAKRRPELRNTYPVGVKFGLWTIISDEVKVGTNRALYQLCQCACGNIAWKSLASLRAGSSTRCKKMW
jgi:predicted transcriptional regulator